MAVIAQRERPRPRRGQEFESGVLQRRISCERFERPTALGHRRAGVRPSQPPQQRGGSDVDGSRKWEAVLLRRSSSGFLLQRAYYVPAPNIGLAAAGTVNDGSAQSEMRIVYCFGTSGGACL
jgi:hypothetical protein